MNGTVIYDGGCNLCNSQVRLLRKLDRKKMLSFVPSESAEGMGVLLAAGLDGAENDTVVYHTRSRYYLRSSAILNILRDIGRGWQILYIFIIIPLFIRDFFYRLIARNRHRIYGRREGCELV